MTQEAKEIQETFEIIISILLSLIFFIFIFGWNYLNKKLSEKYWYIHFHLFSRKISDQQQNILRQNYKFYRNLKPFYQKSFDHRVSNFIKHYKIIGRQDFMITDEIKTIIAGNYVMLTFGMKDYLASSFSKVLVYESHYFSNISQQYHIGEFNPQYNLIVFSWKDFLEGIRIENNNLNLGIHEFAHAILELSIQDSALYNNASKNDYYTSFTKFGLLYEDIIAHITSKHNYDLIKNSGYFRAYAFKNNHEFISVMLEYFFESPQDFNQKFPMLFNKVERMINYREVCFKPSKHL